MFDSKATILTAQALRYYSLGIAAGGISTILNRVFYAMKDTKTPMVNSMISIIINIILNLILIKPMGHRGLALATSIASFAKVILLFKNIKLKFKYFKFSLILKTIYKSLISSIVMGIITCIVYKIFSTSINLGTIGDLLVLLISIGVGAIVYLCMIINMKIDEVTSIMNVFKSKIKKNVC